MKRKASKATDYTAVYLCEDEDTGLTKSGFKTVEDARKYIKSRCCRPDCSACEAEWSIVKTEDLEKCEDLLDYTLFYAVSEGPKKITVRDKDGKDVTFEIK